MANSSFWGRKDTVTSGTLQATATSLQHTADQSSGELAVHGQRGGDGAGVQYPTVLTVPTLCFERVATCCGPTHAYSEPPGWAWVLSAPPDVGRDLILKNQPARSLQQCLMELSAACLSQSTQLWLHPCYSSHGQSLSREHVSAWAVFQSTTRHLTSLCPILQPSECRIN